MSCRALSFFMKTRGTEDKNTGVENEKDFGFDFVVDAGFGFARFG
jgi:hypothetical protein